MLRGCIYARFSTKVQHSIEDQIRVCREWAAKNNIEVLEKHVFSDAAETGKTHRRDGMIKMVTAIRQDEVDVVMAFATNRIYRKSYRSLQFVEEEIIDRRKRCVFVSQSIDTLSTESWRHLIQVFAMIDETHVQLLGGQVRAAHEGLLLRNHVHGTLTFGFRGREVAGPPTRLGKPRRAWEIDPELVKWVVQIFNWWVKDNLGYAQIARRLRKADIQPPPRVKQWTWRAVQHLVTNRRYIGDFSYGWTESVWQNKAGYSRQFQREAPRMVHLDESLRIVDDALFQAAVERASTYRGKGGRKRRGTDGSTSDHMLKDLLWCPQHGRPMTICGAHAQLMCCLRCKRNDEQSLYSMGNRALIEKMLCEELARRIKDDPDLPGMIVAESLRQAQSLVKQDRPTLPSLDHENQRINDKISFILENPGESVTDRNENRDRLARLRAERAALEVQIAHLRQPPHP